MISESNFLNEPNVILSLSQEPFANLLSFESVRAIVNGLPVTPAIGTYVGQLERDEAKTNQERKNK